MLLNRRATVPQRGGSLLELPTKLVERSRAWPPDACETRNVGSSVSKGDPIEGALAELCERLGFCTALRSVEWFQTTDLTIDEFADAVLRSEWVEGMTGQWNDIPVDQWDRSVRRDVRAVVAKWLD